MEKIRYKSVDELIKKEFYEDEGGASKSAFSDGVIKPCLLITLKIEDAETVESYKDVDKSFILEDIQVGTLSDHCEIVNVEHKEAL